MGGEFCIGKHLMSSAELCRLPQFDGISLRVMHSKVHHPDLVRIPEIATLFGKGTEGRRSGLLLPNGSALALWCERNSQVFEVPVPQRNGIMRSEEQPSDSGYFFHFRSSRFMFSSCLRRRSRKRWLCGVLCRHD